MAGADGTQTEDRNLDEDICCGVREGHLAVTNTAWPELIGRMLTTENLMRMYAVV